MSKFPNPPGSYRQTSRDITFMPNEEIPGCYILSASCQRVDGSWAPSSMLFGIMNNDGRLEWNPQENKGADYHYPEVEEGLPAGTYLLSSEEVSIIDNRGEGRAPYTLTAIAKNKRGGYERASLDYDIANCDGRLVFNPKYGC